MGDNSLFASIFAFSRTAIYANMQHVSPTLPTLNISITTSNYKWQAKSLVTKVVLLQERYNMVAMAFLQLGAQRRFAGQF